MNDTVADMLTRIRNAVAAGHTKTDIRRSKICLGIARVLKDEGYIQDFKEVDDDRQGLIRVYLKYGPQGERVIQEIASYSKPGRRVYRGAANLPRVLNGLGICVVSTSSGVLSDRQCREKKVGGEVLCIVS
ncbi:MAG: 30S ribosomal protein S8 [Phycisphaerae bacterium]|nr:30S ribosomal protein S8 [Phycisphaerae bacterium]